MTNINNNNNNNPIPEAFNIKKFVSDALSYKYIYLIVGIICLLVASLVIQFYPTTYEVNSIIGSVEDKNSSLVGSNELFSGLGALGKVRSIEDDINSLNSFSLISLTLSRLNLEVGYFDKKNKTLSRPVQVYPDIPYTVNIDKSHPQPINCRFYISIIDENSFRLSSDEKDIRLYNYVDNLIISKKNLIKTDTICKFNDIISNKNFKFSISLNKRFYTNKTKGEYSSYFEFYHLDELTKEYLKSLYVGQITANSSYVNVRIRGRNVQLIIDFLNKFLQTYLDDNLSKKNKISKNTVQFIDMQISNISDSLLLSESKLKDYRSANQVMDLSYQGQKALEQMSAIETERSNLLIQERYYNYILNYFDKNKDIAGLAPPSTANVKDETMNKLILDLQALNAEKSGISSNNSQKNLFLGQIEKKIKLQTQTIIENVSNNLNTLNLTMNELNYRADKLSKEISSLPRTELNMVSMQRRFNLSDAIYTFLLQKRSEAAITMASNNPDFQILEPAREVTKEIIAPKKVKILALSLFLALLIPTIFVVLKEFFNEKITTTSEIEHISNRSIFGVIFSNLFKTEMIN